MTGNNFSEKEWLRYTRHIQLPQVGASGQQQLKDSHVTVIGAGGLGSPVAYYLAAAGVGAITLVDGDVVDLTNLQRQILFTSDDVGRPKVKCAQQRLLELNSEIQIQAIESELTSENAEEIIRKTDLVLDCTDNFLTRYLINDTCMAMGKPWIFGSISQFAGQCALFTSQKLCFRCLFPKSPQGIADCNTGGVLGVLPGLIGTYQANEALKYLLGLDCPLENTLLCIDAIELTHQKIALTNNPECRHCGKSPNTLDNFQGYFGEKTTQDNKKEAMADEGSVFAVEKEFDSQLLDDQNYQLLDVRTQAERQAFHLGGLHMALDELPQNFSDLDTNKPYLCYCQTGVRSVKAAEFLTQKGIVSYSLRGGLVGYLKRKAIR